ncbi:hypothetical protein AAD018_017005 [Aestuariibius insulae]|uniref:hypothetical protein n=1 Tax=Aestuariibius insulae TaxID=2058287 RepID=UPI00345E3B7B
MAVLVTLLLPVAIGIAVTMATERRIGLEDLGLWRDLVALGAGFFAVAFYYAATVAVFDGASGFNSALEATFYILRLTGLTLALWGPGALILLALRPQSPWRDDDD